MQLWVCPKEPLRKTWQWLLGYWAYERNGLTPYFFSQVLDLSGNCYEYRIVNALYSVHRSTVETLYLNETCSGAHVLELLFLLYDKQFHHRLKTLSLDGNKATDKLILTTIYSSQSSIYVSPRVEILSFAYVDFPFLPCQNVYRGGSVLNMFLKFLITNQRYYDQIDQETIDNPYFNPLKGLNMSHGTASWQSRLGLDKFMFTRCDQNNYPFNLPKNLTWLDVSYYGLHIPVMPNLIMEGLGKSLTHFYASHNNIQEWSATISCSGSVVPVLKHLDISYNQIPCFNSSLFAFCNWSSLQNLDISHNRLGHYQTDTCNLQDSRTFLSFLKPLSNLRELEISGNAINVDISQDSLVTLRKLNSLNMKKMELEEFNLNLAPLEQLHKVDLSENRLQCLHVQVTRALDQIVANNNETPYLNLKLNPLRCSCKCLSFYQWLKHTKVRVHRYWNYTCTFDDGHIAELNNIGEIIRRLNQHCTIYNFDFLMNMFKIFGAVNSLTVIFTILYRLRHFLKYYWLRIRMQRQLLRKALKKEYRFDAFISCEVRDAIGVKRMLLPQLENDETGLQFCIAQRNFLVGATIIDNIMKAISTSRKVVFIISEWFMQSGWCKEELQIAYNVCC